eukprot:TRINITY_DN9094_c0_g1_i1.p1 TRINITY_DN9094_c0_g1~~TRINITY_DN9094_c0_g1_i1.p1  ORF type:complete len:189 (+),score=24.44 TRINITY_DN9094_c0_g1_i1:19-585(+)
MTDPLLSTQQTAYNTESILASVPIASSQQATLACSGCGFVSPIIGSFCPQCGKPYSTTFTALAPSRTYVYASTPSSSTLSSVSSSTATVSGNQTQQYTLITPSPQVVISSSQQPIYSQQMYQTCINHMNVVATSYCDQCAAPLCYSCTKLSGSKNLCPECKQKDDDACACCLCCLCCTYLCTALLSGS